MLTTFCSFLRGDQKVLGIMSLCMFISAVYTGCPPLHLKTNLSSWVSISRSGGSHSNASLANVERTDFVWPQNPYVSSALRDGTHHTSDKESLNPEFIFRIQNLLEHLFHASLGSTIYTLWMCKLDFWDFTFRVIIYGCSSSWPNSQNFLITSHTAYRTSIISI